ncbi:hypothetical protein B0I35DRAFT_464683 [Stachybotrys elegans]|uniref:Uncharacterized protein n=1 Tax=Stachybotrys elegans TaxID=80388 RepID=A0A8K0WKN2_9HYPO|nr:hypothetical protein B0I35DRAFT_464683 [Stachybotrys elegans]
MLGWFKRGARNESDAETVASAQSTPFHTAEEGLSAPSEKQESKGHKGRLAPSTALTKHQIFYIFVLDGLGGMLLSGGVNFALAYAMYTSQNTEKNPIRLFQLPNTLAGDGAVTIIVQCIMTWFVEMGLVRYDLGNRSVQPIGFIPEPSGLWTRKLFMLEPEPGSAPDTQVHRSKFITIVQNALRGFLIAVAGFLLLWPIAVGVLSTIGEPRGGDYFYSDRWIPQAFKCILGGLLGLLTTPLMASFWLLKAGWEAKHGS